MAVLGIDLGTTNSVLATIRSGEVAIIPDRQGRRLHPSVVSLLPDGGKLYSHEAAARRLVDPKHTVYSAKRLMGQSFQSEDAKRVAGRLPYEVREGDNDQVVVVGPDR